MKIIENLRGWYAVENTKGQVVFSSKSWSLCAFYVRNPELFPVPGNQFSTMTYWLTDNLYPSDHVLLPELYHALIRHQALKVFIEEHGEMKYGKQADVLIGESLLECLDLATAAIEKVIDHSRKLEVFGPQQMIELNERTKRIQKVIGAL